MGALHFHRQSPVGGISLLTAGFLAVSVLPSCVLNDNGSTFGGSNVGRSINFEGFTMSPGETVQVQVLSPATADPSIGSNWVTLASVVTSNDPFDVNGTDMYYWNAQATPVPNGGLAARWKAGGLARFRALRGTGATLVSFDETDCWLNAVSSGSSPAQIQQACESHDSPVLTFVDRDPLPNYQSHLTLRQNSLAEATQYNAEVNAPATLDDFRTSRGFPNGEIVAKYYNRGDLGIGRDMHCREQLIPQRNVPDVACYVTNYGNPEDGLADSVSALTDALNGHSPFATVAMDYWSSAPDKVRFYTYDQFGNLIEAAALDSDDNDGIPGPDAKPIPGLCLSCHGGEYDAATNQVIGARFLPFDMEAFDFVESNGGVVLPGPIYTKEGQQEEFRQLNLLVRNTQPGTAIVELIDGWYGGLGGLQTPGTFQDPTFVPAGWANESVTYRKAIAPYCRTCHVALDIPAKPFLDFNEAADLPGSTEAYVCGHLMPHAEVTRSSFWKSSARAHLSGMMGWTSDCD